MAMSLNDLDKFKKLMQMTLSSHDGEVLNAIRMANGLLLRHNHNWEDLIASKIKVSPNARAEPRPGERPQAKPRRKLTEDETNRLNSAFELLMDITIKGSSFGDMVRSIHDQFERTGELTDRQIEVILNAAKREYTHR